MKKRQKSIETQAEQLLKESGSFRIPVPIDLVAAHLNLKSMATMLDNDISGVLVVEDRHGIIGFNSSHPPVRTRFTIAHEIGHYLLHVKQSGTRWFVDRQVYRRDDDSASGSDQEEIEANGFAAALLMPEKLLREEVKKGDLNLDDEDALVSLARRFNVSTSAMSFRLVNLGIVR